MFGTIPTTIPDTTPVITPPVTQTDTPVIPTETPIIAPTIPPFPDYTPASPDYSHASDSESDPSEDPSSDHIPPLPAISPFLSSDDDTTNSDTPDTPPLPSYGTPFTKITASTQRSPIIPRRRVMILSLGQPIPHGRPYRYLLNGPIHMMTYEEEGWTVSCSVWLGWIFWSILKRELLRALRMETLGRLVQRFHDHTQAIPEYIRILAIKGVKSKSRDIEIVRVESASHAFD
ncbi:hypothetical protein Tco_0940569 [Tanacetum coccineum]|uniref:Uncharacterized protein n=1 Tax=Tanacetum coccineum TaxID=301880 RepID=A0ABQ5DV41_9ASTR